MEESGMMSKRRDLLQSLIEKASPCFRHSYGGFFSAVVMLSWDGRLRSPQRGAATRSGCEDTGVNCERIFGGVFVFPLLVVFFAWATLF